MLIYEAYQAPLAQPRNVLGGYIVSSFTGVTTRLVCGYIGIPLFVTGPIAVALAIAFMNITRTLPPPGGACALIAISGGPAIHGLGYGYILTSCGAALLMLAVALLGNKLIPHRQYPIYWL